MQPGQAGSQISGDDWIGRRFKDIERKMQELAAANLLRTAGIGTFDGGVIVEGSIQSKRADGTVGVSMDSAGSVTAYDSDGVTEVARFGPLDNSAPGKYGVEVLVGNTWVQLGAQVATWDNLAGKPADFAPLVKTAVPDATGSTHAYNNNVAGTEYYAVLVGNDSGNKLGRNTSSIRYKENVRPYSVNPAAVLNLEPRIFDRKPVAQPPAVGIGPENMVPAPINEYGLIAEEVNQHLPEIVVQFGGQIDGVRYDLLALALLDVVKNQEARIKTLEESQGAA